MSEWYYRVKAFKEIVRDDGRTEREWGWPPVAFGFVEAESRAAAKAKVEAELGLSLPLRVKREDIGTKFPFFINLFPGDQCAYMRQPRKCAECGGEFTILSKMNRKEDEGWSPGELCGDECFMVQKMRGGSEAGNGRAVPVIYRIRHKESGKVYIGQTKQPFTLRWWQHLSHNETEKFGKAMKESRATDWTFEVIEIVTDPAKLTERERFHIQRENSVQMGYNSV